ncbi:MAG: sigma-70 family RNA polymerase sigma factor [Bacteroidales bacterium]|nr:sigma-70 family RNA polymerase sigma factor [Bacteroidales bacterium]
MRKQKLVDLGDKRFLIEAIRSGDERIFEQFLKAEYNNIVFFSNQFVKDIMLSNDIAQETFISLWNSRLTLNVDLNLRAYTFTIARNKSLNVLRERYHTVSNQKDRREIKAFIDTLSSEYADASINSLDIERIIKDVYEQLPETIRESFVMSRESGLTYNEIAQRKGLSVKAIEYHINVALKLFKKKLKDYLGLF